jgi:hypothetical protein
MLVKGEVKCLHCGFISGSWVGQKGSPVTMMGYTRGSGAADQRPADAASPVRCVRCDGPVFLEDLEPVISSYRLRRIRRLREQIAAIDARGGKAA